MNKQIRILIFVSLLMCFTNETYSQNGREKTILYELNQYDSYSAFGYVSKNQFVENQNVTFKTERYFDYDRILRDTIISGKYFIKDGNSYIDGIWKDYNRDLTEIVRVKGVFKVTNNDDGIGINLNKKKGKKLKVIVLPDKPYYVNFKQGKFSLESNVTNIEEQILYPNIFNELIPNDKKVKLTLNNGDVFIGKVKSRNELPPYSNYDATFAPENGEYRYVSGEISTGVFQFNNYLNRFYLKKGSTVFTDKTVINGDWIYDMNLTNSEQESVYSRDRTPTEMKNMAITIVKEKERKLQEEKLAKEKAEKAELLKKQLHRKKLIEKYGDYYGNKLSRGELLPGMNEDMVKEVWEKEWFNINNIVRNGQMIEIWEFDKSKMQIDIIKKGKESGQQEGALGLILMLNLSEELGLEGINAPKTLVFIDNKLTDIYR